MFQQLFTAAVSIARHESLPFAAERQLYLKHLVDEGRSRKTPRNTTGLTGAARSSNLLNDKQVL